MSKETLNLVRKVCVSLVLFFSIQIISDAQVTVALDNWYNRETNAKTGKPFHYLWNDSDWSGYSRWGKIFVDRGAVLTTIEKPSVSNLRKANIYIIVDPDSVSESKAPNYIMPDDILVIEKWVKKGGVLVLLANDGPNCEFTHLNNLSERFGIYFDHNSLHKVDKDKWDMGAFTRFSDHPVFKGIKKIYMKEISSLTLQNTAKPILEENGKVFAAESKIGKGTVIAIGDPWIYNEYMDHDRLPQSFQNRKAAENFTSYLIALAKGSK